MIKKLEQKNSRQDERCTRDELQEIIENLKNSNFLNDQNFAELFIDSQIRRRPQGKMKLEYRLRQKGVDPAIIKQKLNLAHLNELELANTLAGKKLRTLNKTKIDQQKIEEKISRFLYSRGFSSETIYKVISQKLYK
jgi:regulatory protein